jgi:hypothetical protein
MPLYVVVRWKVNEVMVEGKSGGVQKGSEMKLAVGRRLLDVCARCPLAGPKSSKGIFNTLINL